MNNQVLPYLHDPTEFELQRMNNFELFIVANRSAKLREELVKFILSQKVKPIVSPIEAHNVREIGLPERLKNALLYADFLYLTDLTVVKKSDVLMLRGIGKKSYDDLMLFMDKYGLKLVQE